jgi:hypothetical protein
MTSREKIINPALSFIRDDERELGDTGNLLTLSKWHMSFLAIPQKYRTDKKVTRTKERREELLSSPPVHHYSVMQGLERDIFLPAYLSGSISVCTVP